VARFNKAVELQRKGELKEAEKEYRAVLAAAPNYAEAHANLGAVLIRLDRYEEAISSYEKAFSLAPKLTPILMNIGIAHYRKSEFEKAVEALKKLTAPKAHVLRDGKEMMIPAREVVPGDLLLLESGDTVPADARVLEAIELKADEAVLTGESTPVGKVSDIVKSEAPIAERKNMLFMATHTSYGRGKAVVTSTGMGTGVW
jgi:magnesium-transporting ATPase (P-type)